MQLAYEYLILLYVSMCMQFANPSSVLFSPSQFHPKEIPTIIFPVDYYYIQDKFLLWVRAN